MHEIPAPAPGPTPAWDEFLGRLSCPETFLAWIWSVVEARHRGRQCLYLHGPEGQDGKTYVSEVIGTMMGPLHTPMSDWRASDPHSTSALVGKRFATKDDLKNPHIGNLQLFRSVLSGSTEQINEKYKQPRKEFLYVRVMITANRMPEISNAGASESSRFLIVRVGASSIKSDPTWPDRLKAELPHLLHRARAAYSRLCLNHGDIAVTPPTATLIDEAQGEESDRWAVLAEAVEFGDGKNATAAELNGLLTRLGLKGYEAKDAQAWLRSRPGVDRAMVRRGPSVVRGWKGLRVRAEQTGVADDTFEPANTNATPEAANN